MSARYLCLHCWRTPSSDEAAARPPELTEPEARAAAPEAETAPEAGATPVAPPVAARLQPRPGLHWIEDPNPPPANSVAAAPAMPAAAAPPAPRRQDGSPRSRWSGWVDSLLGEEEGAPGERREGAAVCRCGAALGAEQLMGARPSLLGFAGESGAGKSLLLLAMLHQLEQEGEYLNGRRLALLPLGDAGAVFRARRAELFRHGRRPEPDQGGAGYGWQVSFAAPGSSARRELPLPGGRAQLVALFGGEGAAENERYHALLERVVLVVDGAVLAADLELGGGDAWGGPARPGDLGAADQRQLAVLRRSLGPRARDTSLAIVITKADLLAESLAWSGLGPGGDLAGAEREAAIAQLLKETWRGPLLEEARAYFRRVGLFACSSLGFRPAPGDLGEAGELRRRPQPRETLAPLRFLLDDLGPRRRA